MKRCILTYDEVRDLAREADAGRARLRRRLQAEGFDVTRAISLRTNRDACAAVYEQEDEDDTGADNDADRHSPTGA